MMPVVVIMCMLLACARDIIRVAKHPDTTSAAAGFVPAIQPPAVAAPGLEFT